MRAELLNTPLGIPRLPPNFKAPINAHERRGHGGPVRDGVERRESECGRHERADELRAAGDGERGRHDDDGVGGGAGRRPVAVGHAEREHGFGDGVGDGRVDVLVGGRGERGERADAERGRGVQPDDGRRSGGGEHGSAECERRAVLAERRVADGWARRRLCRRCRSAARWRAR